MKSYELFRYIHYKKETISLHNRHFLECFALVPEQGATTRELLTFFTSRKNEILKRYSEFFFINRKLFFRTLFGQKSYDYCCVLTICEGNKYS